MSCRNLMHRLLGGSGGQTFLQALQALDPSVHIYPLDDTQSWETANAPWNEAGDTTQSDNTNDRIQGGDADEKINNQSPRHSSPIGTGCVQLTEQDASPVNENFIEAGIMNHAGDTPVNGRTVGGWLQWDAPHSTGPTANCSAFVCCAPGTMPTGLLAGLGVGLASGVTNGTTVPYNTKLYARTNNSANNYDVSDMSVAGNMFVLQSEDVGGGNYTHRVFWNGVQIRSATNTNPNLASSSGLNWMFGTVLSEFAHSGKPVDMFVEDLFYMHDTVLIAPQVLSLYDNFKL